MVSKVKAATDTFSGIAMFYIVVMAASAGLFSWLEDKPYFDSLWWASATAMTVGYGDIFPVTMAGKVLAMFLMHFVVLVIAPLIVVRLTSKLIENKNNFSHEEQEQLKIELKEIKKLLSK